MSEETKTQAGANAMLNSETAINLILRIEGIRASAETNEAAVFAEMRAMPDYEPNADKDLLEAVRLRAEARAAFANAEVLINAFDWVYDEAAGENRRKVPA